MDITIFGHGNLAQAVGNNFTLGGNNVHYITHENGKKLGDLIVLAVPYPAIDDIVSRYNDQFAGKVVIDATNPIDFQKWQLLVPADSSSAAELAEKLPNSKVLKAFNTVTAVNLANGKLGNGQAPQVLVAGDSDDAKQTLRTALQQSPLSIVTVGGLDRARELESLGLLELSMAAHKQLAITGGFLIINQ